MTICVQKSTMNVFVLVFVAIFALAHGKPALKGETEVYKSQKLGLTVHDLATQDSLDVFLAALKKFIDDGDVGDIFNLEMNPIIDDLLVNVKSGIIRGGLDPLQLEDETLQLLGIVGSIKLTSGWLQDISTIARGDDVVASYNSANKKMTFTLPLTFDVLLFTYEYVTRVTLLSISGDVQGKIEDVIVNAQVTFDPATEDFVIDSLDMHDSGKITVKFSGNGLVDWLTNAMTEVITLVLHPLIVAILESNVKVIGLDIVDVVNEYVHSHI